MFQPSATACMLGLKRKCSFSYFRENIFSLFAKKAYEKLRTFSQTRKFSLKHSRKRKFSRKVSEFLLLFAKMKKGVFVSTLALHARNSRPTTSRRDESNKSFDRNGTSCLSPHSSTRILSHLIPRVLTHTLGLP
jgi:hypothetical protein